LKCECECGGKRTRVLASALTRSRSHSRSFSCGLRPTKPGEGLALTESYKNKKPSFAKATEGGGGPSWTTFFNP